MNRSDVACTLPRDKRTAELRVARWASEGLLPVGNPGTGNHRAYDAASVEMARVLDALTDLGLDVGAKRKLAPYLARNPKYRSVIEHLREVVRGVNEG